MSGPAPLRRAAAAHLASSPPPRRVGTGPGPSRALIGRPPGPVTWGGRAPHSLEAAILAGKFGIPEQWEREAAGGGASASDRPCPPRPAAPRTGPSLAEAPRGAAARAPAEPLAGRPAGGCAGGSVRRGSRRRPPAPGRQGEPRRPPRRAAPPRPEPGSKFVRRRVAVPERHARQEAR